MNAPATIGLVDNEPKMLQALSRLLREKGFIVRTFASADEFLAGFTEPRLDCAVLDVAMPGLDGLELRHVISGSLNKQIAGELGVSEQTIKVHRMRITEKMGLVSVAALVRASERLHIAPAN